MSARRSLFFGFLTALFVHVAVFTLLAFGVILQSDWALVQIEGAIVNWPIALTTYVLLGFVLGRVIWDSRYPPLDDRIDASKSELLQTAPAT